ncbi:2-keto-4-pentenoate hydratase [Flavonifractor hominis]|uniref:Fumarylacetoacetate hydrolase family protein n=1 Tax=Flavonifractor hominis TaxID=3133178 RepID=A0ABV1EQG6_9FIRM
MSASYELLNELAERSLRGEREIRSIAPFYTDYPELDVHDGYAGQKLRLQKMEAEGHKRVGAKLGGTSLAKSRQIQTDLSAGTWTPRKAPTCGILMDYMQIEGEELVLDELIHPKLEAELAFVLGKELYGPFVTAPDVMMATAYVVPAFEIIDSRFHNFKMGGKADAIIDNISAARFKLGNVFREPLEVDMIGMGVRTSFNGQITGHSAAGAVMGHPARAVASLAKTLYEEMGLGLPAGSIILTGAICASHVLTRGDEVVSDFEGMGSLRLRVV